MATLVSIMVKPTLVNFIETQGGKSLGEAVLPTASLSFDLFQWY